jgi:hypothetical protein
MLSYQLQNKEEDKIDLEESRKLGDEWLNSDLKKKLEEERKKKENQDKEQPKQ